MKPIVLYDMPLTQEAITILEKECEVIHCEQGGTGMDPAVRRQAAAATPGAVWLFNKEEFENMPNLLVVARPGIGVDNIDIAAATEAGVVVVNVPDGPTVSTAEHSLAKLLALAKHHKQGARQLAKGISTLEERGGLLELKGKTLGLVGFGRIGKRMAHLCGTGLEMKVIVYDPYIPEEEGEKAGITLCTELDDVLKEADFVSLHCPPNEKTKGMINAKTLSLMKPTAYLINCARGSLVDEDALVDALQKGGIAGAGMDVFDPEPPPPDHPLLSMENVVATPHTAGLSDISLRAITVGAAEGVLSIIAGERPKNLVNPAVWDSPKRRKLKIS